MAITSAALFTKLPLLFLSGGIWAVVGGMAGASTQNKYLAYAVPFISYYMLANFQSRYFKTAYLLSPNEWLSPTHVSHSMTIIFLIIVFIVLSILYTTIMKGRLKDV